MADQTKRGGREEGSPVGLPDPEGHSSDRRLGTAGSGWLSLAVGVGMAVWLGVRLAMAHGDTHEMVKAVTEELRSRPRDPDLYIRRAELHRRHGDFDLALADYETASRYASPPPASLDLMRGLLFLEAKWPFAARAYLDRYLGRETNHVVALAARARANLELKDRDAAIRDFDAAIRHSSEPRPELYIERAQALVTAEGSRLQEAVDGLDEGMRRLGPVVTLQLQAIDLLLRMRQTNAALSRVDRIIEQSPRKETWLARRGEILMQAGRWAEANEAFTNAIAQLATLPPARRSVPAIQELEKRLRQAAAEAAGHHP